LAIVVKVVGDLERHAEMKRAQAEIFEKQRAPAAEQPAEIKRNFK